MNARFAAGQALGNIMGGEATLKEVIARLGKAIDALENAVAARIEQARVDLARARARVDELPPGSASASRASM